VVGVGGIICHGSQMISWVSRPFCSNLFSQVINKTVNFVRDQWISVVVLERAPPVTIDAHHVDVTVAPHGPCDAALTHDLVKTLYDCANMREQKLESSRDNGDALHALKYQG
jgi:hypothetical protein